VCDRARSRRRRRYCLFSYIIIIYVYTHTYLRVRLSAFTPLCIGATARPKRRFISKRFAGDYARALHRRRRKSPADRYYIIRYAATASSVTALSRRRVVVFPAECQIVIAAGDRPINCNANAARTCRDDGRKKFVVVVR